jgi:molybdopterin-guanine dinucleotide biosynthesis protein A
VTSPITQGELTLGILAGGRATRLGGVDKAWLERGGVAQVIRWQRRFADETCGALVSANRELARYADAGLLAVPDRTADDLGPIAGLDALFARCRTPWMLTLPVDLVGVNDCLLPSLVSGAAGTGAFAIDDEGPQPLVALWNVAAAAVAATAMIRSNETAVHILQARLGMPGVRLAGVRFGNLNTPEDLRAAGMTNG